MAIHITEAWVSAQHDDSSTLDVTASVGDGPPTTYKAVIREGRSDPDVTVLNNQPVNGDLAMAIMEALDEQCEELVAAEMDRICGG